MPIYQRPTDNIGVTKTFSGTITDSGSTPIEGAVVALKRKGGGIVAFADTDASGNYSFNIDADGDFQIEYSLSKDSNVRTTTDELSPSNPFSYYDDNDSNTGYYACVGVPDFPQTSGSPTTWCAGVPTAEVVDAGPYLLNDAILTYGFTGPGEGAKVSVSLCPSGGYYASYSQRVLFDHDPQGGIGYPLHRYNITSFGRNYQSPALKLTGTVVLTYGGSLQNAIDAGFTTAFSFNGFTFFTENRSWYYQIAGRQLELGISQIESFWGADHSLWGTYQSDYNGGKFTAALPGEQDKSNFNTTAHSIDDVLNPLCDEATNRIGGSALYYRMIYGPGGTDESPKRGGALLSDGKLSGAEVDLLKGWFGQHHWIKDLAQTGGPDITRYSDVITFAYQFIDGVVKTAKALANGLNNFTISSNTPLHMQAYAAVNPITWTIYNKIGAELQQARRQVDGTLIPENQYAKVIYPLLKKADIGVKSNTEGGNGLSDLEFTTTGPNNETITYRITPTEIVRTVTY